MSDPLRLLAAIRKQENKISKLHVPRSVPAQALVITLQDCRNIKELILSGNRYSESEFSAVLETLSLNKSLAILDVSGMSLSDDEVRAVADLVKHAPTLSRLDLSHNDVSCAAAAVLGDAIKDHPSMKTLILRDTDLKDEGLDAFIATVGVEGCGLHKLCVAQNGITDQGAGVLASFARRNMSLTNINANGNQVPGAEKSSIQQSCERNIARLGFDPSSRPASVASRAGNRLALSTSAHRNLCFLATCEGTALPNLTAVLLCDC